jgi:hypothetical protein
LGQPALDSFGATQEAIERLRCQLARDVPERDVERAQRVRRDALPLDAAVGAIHPLPQALHEERVLTDQQRGKAGHEVGLDGFDATAAERERVAEPGDALVGADVRHRQAVVGEVERDRLASRNAQDGGVDGRDFHGRILGRPGAYPQWDPVGRSLP